MAETSSIKNAALGVTAALGSFGILALIGVMFVGVLLLSLIPLYVSNTSEQGYGEIYRISALTIKAIYTNLTVNFTGGSVLSTADLSRICTTIMRAKNVKDFQACIATNFVAYGPSNDTSGTSAFRRRRGLDDTSLYEIGDILLLFSSTCSNRRALGQWYTTLTEDHNSSCVARRASACRAFITSPNEATGSNQWSPFPAGYSQIVYTNGTTCASIAVSRIYTVASSWYPIVNNRYNITRPLGVRFGDCKLDSVQSQPSMQTLIDTTMNPPISQCTSVIG